MDPDGTLRIKNNTYEIFPPKFDTYCFVLILFFLTSYNFYQRASIQIFGKSEIFKYNNFYLIIEESCAYKKINNLGNSKDLFFHLTFAKFLLCTRKGK